jgi:hypothetical protein
MFTYPTSRLDQADDLHHVLGSFWYQLYGDRDMIAAYCGAKGQLELQTLSDLNEVAAAVSRSTCPVYHRVRWLPLVLVKSQGVLTAGGVTYPVPAGLAEAPVACCGISVSVSVLVQDLDYSLNATGIEFATDPFTQPKFPQQAVYDQSGNQTDLEIVLWLFRAGIDVGLLYRQFGYVLGLSFPSSVGYKRAVNVGWDALTAGSARKDLDAALVTITDAPLAVGNEIVLQTISDFSSLLVITDLNVYRYAQSAVPLVVSGQAVSAGQPLTDVFRVYDLGTGQVPPVASIMLGPGFLDPSVQGPLTFQNTPVPLQVSTAADGHTVAQFSVDGTAADVTQFWARMDAKGLASGNTLARLLDTRTNKQGEPSAANLPTSINPAQFLVQNVLRYNALLVTVRSSALGPNAMGLENLSFLRKVVPPHTALIVQVS